MKVVISPAYNYLESFINAIPRGEYPCEKVFCNHRNTVELVRVGEQRFVVKKFKRPTIANCIIYTWFRKNKAQHAWENAYLFQKLGLETANPVAYIVCKKYGFFHTAWFISDYLPYPNIEEVFLSCETKEEKESLMNAFVEYTLHLHELGIVHRDYNKGNILVHKEADGFHFAMIDINRLWFIKNPNVQLSMRSLLMLKMSDEAKEMFLQKYAEKRGFNVEDCQRDLHQFEHYKTFRHQIKTALKRLIKKDPSPIQ